MKQAILFFESHNYVMRVVGAAKKAGYAVIALNQMKASDHPPYGVHYKDIDHIFDVESWEDHDKLETIIAEIKKDYEIVGTLAAFESALPFESKLRTFLGLPVNELTVIENALNKLWVRQTLYKAGLSNLQSYEAQEVVEMAEWPFKRAVYLKPAHGAASAFVYRCPDKETFLRCYEKTQDRSVLDDDAILRDHIQKLNTFVVEEEGYGELISVECLVHKGEVNVLGIQSRNTLVRDRSIEMGISFPYRLPNDQEIREKVIAAHHCIGLTQGPTHTEVMVSEDGEIEIVEINIRFAGAEALVSISFSADHPVENLLLESALGNPIDVSPFANPKYVSCSQFLLPPSSVRNMESVEVPEDEILFLKMAKELPSDIPETCTQLDLYGSFIIRAGSYDEVREISEDIRKRILVNGQPVGDDVNNIVTW